MPLEEAIREELNVEILAVGLTHDAMIEAHLLAGYPKLRRLPDRRDGGLIHLVAAVVSGDPARRLDAVIYLLDPNDPTAIFPESQALKRECVIHETLFVSTLAHAQEWFELARTDLGLRPNPLRDVDFDYATQIIALIAHDARKTEMLEFAREQFDFLDHFRKRIATGTTGSMLNELAAQIVPSRALWVQPFRSGPLGGDAEIALEILEGRCRRVLFFEDPHVARQHEADIQLLERSAWTTTDRTVCVSDRASAELWVSRCKARAELVRERR